MVRNEDLVLTKIKRAVSEIFPRECFWKGILEAYAVMVFYELMSRWIGEGRRRYNRKDAEAVFAISTGVCSFEFALFYGEAINTGSQYPAFPKEYGAVFLLQHQYFDECERNLLIPLCRHLFSESFAERLKGVFLEKLAKAGLPSEGFFFG